jgi:integrase/recombinase XerD
MHFLRRCFATHLLQQGAEVRYIQNLLGHKKIDTTMEYINVDVSDLRSALVDCHPREKILHGANLSYKGVQRA